MRRTTGGRWVGRLLVLLAAAAATMLMIVLATVSAAGVALASARAGAPRPEGPRVPEVAVSVIRAGGAEGAVCLCRWRHRRG
jgi:hypothetical protein